MAEQLGFMGRSAVYVLEAFVLMWIAKFAYTRIYRRVSLKDEIFGRANSALAVSTAGYLLGIVIALGGVLTGPSAGLQADLTSIAFFGLQTVVMMLVASFICEKLLLHHFDNTKEIVEDQNLGTAFVEAGLHIANGLILLSIQQGAGAWQTGIAFWAIAQVVLLLAGLLYEWTTSHSIHDELERDNAAVGLAFGGVLVGMGNIVSISVGGDFTGWAESLKLFAADVLFGLVALYLIKKLTDLLLAPGVSLAGEQTAETPRIGAGLL
ncbi:MAG: DUF350 domain-containing protein, partial [Gemmatimonadetes bacterium]|nr:DUF350 domain-containing protein [Gemmatimonadota bacterium]